MAKTSSTSACLLIFSSFAARTLPYPSKKTFHIKLLRRVGKLLLQHYQQACPQGSFTFI